MYVRKIRYQVFQMDITCTSVLRMYACIHKVLNISTTQKISVHTMYIDISSMDWCITMNLVLCVCTF